MSNVNLVIGGRSFAVACAEGEEDHITGLGRMIDGKLHAMGGATGQSETRMLLFSALLLADELHEIKAGKAPAAAPINTSRLDAIADRLEILARTLEG